MTNLFVFYEINMNSAAIMIRTFLSQPYIHLLYTFFVLGLSEHHVVVIKSGGNIRCPSEKSNIPPAFYYDYMIFRQIMNKNYMLGCI